MDYPDEAQAINELQGKIRDAWELLIDKCQWRKLQLQQTVDLFRLLLLVENHVLWINDMYDDINNLEEPRYIIYFALAFIQYFIITVSIVKYCLMRIIWYAKVASKFPLAPFVLK